MIAAIRRFVAARRPRDTYYAPSTPAGATLAALWEPNRQPAPVATDVPAPLPADVPPTFRRLPRMRACAA